MSDKKYKSLQVLIQIDLPFLSDLPTALAFAKIIEAQILSAPNPPKVIKVEAIEEENNNPLVGRKMNV
jgi:hypothetical protein